MGFHFTEHNTCVSVVILISMFMSSWEDTAVFLSKGRGSLPRSGVLRGFIQKDQSERSRDSGRCLQGEWEQWELGDGF